MSNLLTLRCPVCHRDCTVPHDFIRNVCACGTSVLRSGIVEYVGKGQSAPKDVRHARFTTCLFCAEWMGGHRCRAIEGGCRSAYYRALLAVEPLCDFWKGINDAGV